MLNRNVQIDVLSQKFEDLLATDNLFVDYFNSFLALPSFHERLTFNYESGDLEIVEENDEINKKKNIEDDEDDEHAKTGRQSDMRIKKLLMKRAQSELPSTGRSIKHNLQYNIKRFIDKEETKNPPRTKTATPLLNKDTRNHSFRDMQSLEIRPQFEPIDIKDPKTAAQLRMFVVNTKYNVKTLRKPKSIIWLNIRRLSLFMQSIFYSEYKLSKLLSQCRLNGNGTPVVSDAKNKLKFYKVEIDQEMDDVNYNPFKAKTHLQKLREHPGDLENELPKDQDLNDFIQGSNLSEEELKEKYKKVRLFNNDSELYRALKYQTFNTTLLFNDSKRSVSTQLALTNKPNEERKAVEDDDVKKGSSVKISEQKNEIINDNDSSILSSDSEDFGHTYDRSVINASCSTRRSYLDSVMSSNKHVDSDLELDFEDEDKSLSGNKISNSSIRREDIEGFKAFIKDTDGNLYFKFWVEVERIQMLRDENEKINALRQLKITYNRPELLQKLSKLNSNQSGNILLGMNTTYWSLENLTNNVQKLKESLDIIFNHLRFPKYLLHLNFSNKNVSTVSLLPQQFVPLEHKDLTDVQVDNIQKSIKESNTVISAKTKQRAKKQKLISEIIDRNNLEYVHGLYKERYNVERQRRVVQKSAGSILNFYEKKKGMKDLTVESMTEAEFMTLFKTSPPVGFKRPIYSSKSERKPINLPPEPNENADKVDRAVYYEAVTMDSMAGNCFLKYLKSVNRHLAVNWLSCLQEVTKFKELFYDEHFNKDSAKYFALRIYSKYIAVSAVNDIECDKTECLRLHNLFVIPENRPEQANRPVYEDTFDNIEEFLFDVLFNEWVDFNQTENSYFKKVEISKIERNIRVKSRKLEELKRKGLVRFLHQSTSKIDQVYQDSIKQSKQSPTSETKNQNDSGISEDNCCNMYEFAKNKRNLHIFKKYLEENDGLDDLLCWLDIESYCQINEKDKEKMNEESRNIKRKYLSRRYLFGIRSPIDEETQNSILENIGGWNVLLQDRPPNNLILLAKNYAQIKLENYWLPKYFKSDVHKEIELKSKTRMSDVVNDLIYLRKKSATSVDSKGTVKDRWVYSSHAIINFRKALKNPFTVKMFQKYLQLKSSDQSDIVRDKLINNLQFLVDVREYKELYQRNVSIKLLIFKVKQIIDAYINNELAPKLLIDIPKELANTIMTESDYLSPYLFHEANSHVFYLLIPLWLQFDQLRSAKDLDMSQEYLAFKNLKKYDAGLNGMNAESDNEKKWKHSQYIKILKTQMIT